MTGTPKSCANSAIAVSDAGGTAGLGHEDQVLIFTNLSGGSCTLSGYPGVAALDSSGHQVVQARRTLGGYLGGLAPGSSIPIVALKPRQSASAIVEGTDNPIGTATSCPDYPALLVTPPNLTKSVRVTITGLGNGTTGFPGCSGLAVHPVVSGTSGSAPGS